MGNLPSTDTDKEIDRGTIRCLGLNGASLNYCVTSMYGCRENMEDFHLACRLGECALFGVFDGHGGTSAAKFAATHMPRLIESQFAWKSYCDSLQNDQISCSSRKKLLTKAIMDAFLQLDRELLVFRIGQEQQLEDSGKVDRTVKDAGSTANIVLVTEKWLVCGNLGDTRALALSENTFEALSKDHKPDDNREKMRIIRSGGCVLNNRVCGDLAVSRSFGDFRFKDVAATMQGQAAKQNEQQVSPLPDVRFYPWCDVNYLLLGCDGVFEVLSDHEVVKSVRKGLASSKHRGENLEIPCKEVRPLTGFGQSRYLTLF